MKNILVLSFSYLNIDPRITRQINLLIDNYNVTVTGFTDAEIKGTKYIPITKSQYGYLKKIKNIILLKLGFFKHYYWSLEEVKSGFDQLKNEKYDLIIANDIKTLPLAVELAKKGAKLLLDAHEYAPRQFEDSLVWRVIFQKYVDWMCREYLPQATRMITVCKGIADEYKNNYRVESSVITNATNYYELQPSPISEGSIRIVHHGDANPSRKLELMIDAVSKLDGKYSLDFYLVGNKKYISFLKQKAQQYKNIKFQAPVPMSDIPNVTNKYDIGLYLLAPTNFNNAMALPNKLFEYIQARLALVIGPTPEMARLVNKYDCGVVASDFTSQSLAEAVESITSDKLKYFKSQSNIAAKELNLEANKEKIITMLQEMLKG